jgi:ABC-type multidrug transport system ATPase subunit
MKQEIILKIQNVDKCYGKQKIIDDLNMNIYKNDIYGFIGENGSGKTTTIKLITGLLKKDRGSIFFEEKEIVEGSNFINSNTRCLFDTPPNLDYLTPRSYLQLFSLIYGNTNLSKGRILDILDSFELKDYIDKRIKTFSYGMRKKLYLSTLLIGTHKLVILDEPTNGLDVKSIIKFRDFIINLNREYGTTIILSSHMLSEIETLCNRIGIIKKGKILEEKTMNLYQKSSCETFCFKTDNNINNVISLLKQNSNCNIVRVNESNKSVDICLKRNLIFEVLKEFAVNDIQITECFIKKDLSEYFMEKIES